MSDSAAAKGSAAQAPPATEKVEEKFAGLHFDNEDDEGPQEPLVEFEEGEDEDGVADEEDAEQDERQPVKVRFLFNIFAGKGVRVDGGRGFLVPVTWSLHWLHGWVVPEKKEKRKKK